ncbi:MAG: SHOCT domain-containing protein [Syntrophales bacterium]|nr:SHOCT domain-containing protein [Syntrophales bacterium]
MYPGEHFWWGGWWMFPMIMPIIGIVIMVIVLYSVFGRGGCRPPWRDRYADKEVETALDILKKRYAKGELNKEEFERMKKDLLD